MRDKLITLLNNVVSEARNQDNRSLANHLKESDKEQLSLHLGISKKTTWNDIKGFDLKLDFPEFDLSLRLIEKSPYDSMVVKVNIAIENYFYILRLGSKPGGTSLGELYKGIVSLRRHAIDLRDFMTNFDPPFQKRLYGAKNIDFYKYTLKALDHIIAATNLHGWKPSLKKGPAKNIALSKTVKVLSDIYGAHVNRHVKKRQRAHEFISSALGAANIDHPDLSDHRSRFNKLLRR
ncbi:MAG: hypothetical protein HY036_06910 [Nitrospirae bacterium]|nr:hypothetical protein [Nitrospirota bacterium]MBI3352292.1 hypothetical protein [Nitrospirota bacterium]